MLPRLIICAEERIWQTDDSTAKKGFVRNGLDGTLLKFELKCKIIIRRKEKLQKILTDLASWRLGVETRFFAVVSQMFWDCKGAACEETV